MLHESKQSKAFASIYDNTQKKISRESFNNYFIPLSTFPN